MIDYILPPLIGAFIGYITNWLAIKMLFRPFEEKRIFNIKIPFTPGLIPKQREEISTAIAKTIYTHLITPEKLNKLFKDAKFQEILMEDLLHNLIDKLINDIQHYIEDKFSFIGKSNIEKIFDKYKPKLKEKIINLVDKEYKEDIEKNLEEKLIKVIQRLDIEKMVKETLMEIDLETLENIILGFSQKQLKYITYLGGVIGFFIGILQVILNLKF